MPRAGATADVVRSYYDRLSEEERARYVFPADKGVKDMTPAEKKAFSNARDALQKRDQARTGTSEELAARKAQRNAKARERRANEDPEVAEKRKAYQREYMNKRNQKLRETDPERYKATAKLSNQKRAAKRAELELQQPPSDTEPVYPTSIKKRPRDMTEEELLQYKRELEVLRREKDGDELRAREQENRKRRLEENPEAKAKEQERQLVKEQRRRDERIAARMAFAEQAIHDCPDCLGNYRGSSAGALGKPPAPGHLCPSCQLECPPPVGGKRDREHVKVGDLPEDEQALHRAAKRRNAERAKADGRYQQELEEKRELTKLGMAPHQILKAADPEKYAEKLEASMLRSRQYRICATDGCTGSAASYYSNFCLLCRNEGTSQEAQILEFLLEAGINAFLQNRVLPCGKSKLRPDFVFPLEDRIVVLEVDENYHRSYTSQCELTRLEELRDEFSAEDKALIFCRFNPTLKTMTNAFTGDVTRQHKIKVGTVTEVSKWRLFHTLRFLFSRPLQPELAPLGYYLLFVDYPDRHVERYFAETSKLRVAAQADAGILAAEGPARAAVSDQLFMRLRSASAALSAEAKSRADQGIANDQRLLEREANKASYGRRTGKPDARPASRQSKSKADHAKMTDEEIRERNRQLDRDRRAKAKAVIDAEGDQPVPLVVSRRSTVLFELNRKQ